MKKFPTVFLTLLFPVFLFAVEQNLIVSNAFSAVTNIDFYLSYEDITLENIYGDEILLEIYSNDNHKIPQINQQEETISLTSAKISKLYSSDYCHIKVYIPYELQLSNLRISTLSGKIDFQKISAEEISLKTKEGKIQGQNLLAISNISIQSEKGNIDINAVTSETVSGTSTNGSIYFSLLKADYFDFLSTKGLIEINLQTPPKASSYVKTKTGDIEISIQEKSGFDLIVFSTNGIFKDEINNSRFSPRNIYQNSYFGGGAELHISSFSGNVLLK